MILPYYKIERTEEGSRFFFANIGYFNFWDEYLIMNIGYNNCYIVLVNRSNRKFVQKCKSMEIYEIIRNLYIECSTLQRMFVDFPELKRG